MSEIYAKPEYEGLIPLIEALRSCFKGVEYMWISPTQEEIVAFVWEKNLTEEHRLAWAALAPSFSERVAIEPAAQMLLGGQRIWGHGYHEQRLRRNVPKQTQSFDWLLLDRPPMPEAAIPAGILPMDLEELGARFCFNEQRRKLYSDLKLLLRICYICFGDISSVWLGGSFISAKECPDDVDAYIFIKHETWEAARRDPTKAQRAQLLCSHQHLNSQNNGTHYFIFEEFEGEAEEARPGSQEPYSQYLQKRAEACALLSGKPQFKLNYERTSEPVPMYGRGFVELVL